MANVAVIGVGMTRFGKFPDRSVEDLGREACWNAIQDAGINPREVQAAFCGHIYQGSVAGQRVLVELGLTGIPIYNIENACASSSSGMELGCLGIQVGQWPITTGQAGPPPPGPPPPSPASQTIKGIITAVVLAQTPQDQSTITVDAGNIAYRVRITADTAITRIEVGSGSGGSAGVASLRPGDDAEVTFANNIATRIRTSYLMTSGRIEAIARAGRTLVLADGRSIKWAPEVVVLVDGKVAGNGADALKAGQTVELRLNPTTREAWEIRVTS